MASGTASGDCRSFSPQLVDVQVGSFWKGYCALTETSLPSIQRLEPNVYALIGFSTRGVALAPILGREMAHFLSGKKREAEMPLPIGEVQPIGLQSVKAFLGGFAFPVYQMRDALRLT